MMERIIIHWTAGTHNAGDLDRRHYHFVIEGDGTVVTGQYAPEDNESTSTPYAAHTRSLNTGSIGVAFAAMHGAKERPFSAGKYPITEAQIDALTALVADLGDKYRIPITPRTILTHAEVQGTLGVTQRGKWDVMWLPGMTQPGHPETVGNLLRERVRLATIKSTEHPPAPWWMGIVAAFAAIFGGRKR